MTTTAQILGNAGPKASIMLADGKKYYLSQLDQGMKEEFAMGLRERMEDIIDRKAAKYRKKARDLWDLASKLKEKEEDSSTPTTESIEIGERRMDTEKEAKSLEIESRFMLKELNDAVAAGNYEFHGLASLQAQATPSGAYAITWLMMRPNHPGLTLAEVTAMYQVSEAQSEKLQKKIIAVNGGDVGQDEKNAESPASTPVEISSPKLAS